MSTKKTIHHTDHNANHQETTMKTHDTNSIVNAIYLTPPPSVAQIPQPPPGFVAPPGGANRGLRPRRVELVAIADAVVELGQFTDFEATLGKAVPPHDAVTRSLELAAQWSNMRAAASAWDEFASTQEGIAWAGARDQLARVAPVFALAAKADPTLVTRFPKLAALLTAKQSIAKKGAATRAANRSAKAKGKPETHGVVGKRRKRAAEKAALLAQEEAALPQPPEATPQAPAAAPAVTVSVNAPPAVANAASGANGAAHA